MDLKGAGWLGQRATWALGLVAVAMGVTGLLMLAPVGHPQVRLVPAQLVAAGLPPSSLAPPLSWPAPPTSSPAPPPSTPAPPPGPLAAVAPTGCPPPPRPPGPPAPPPWHPAVLIPESALPVPPRPSPRVTNLAAMAGKGMWIWQPRRTEGGNADAIVRKAVAAGLTQLWVRVGDSQSGFYGSAFLAALVPVAHAKGLAVIGWGFPHLYDPVADARWTKAALAWRTAAGDQFDGWSADIETASEGVALSAGRATTYLGLIRPATGGRPLVATVFPPTDHWLAVYPYQAMAPYIDAFAPMIYWSCREPGDAAMAAIQRLAALAPVHLIGQAYDMAPEGGRVGHPSAAEISRFLDVARRQGAVGVSFWDWQEIDQREWAALSSYPWLGPVSGSTHAGAA